jgi:class 3 adenylate cyclase/tetratricopeptide (TPR) repeat protein
MECPQCQFENRETRKFCAECGAKLAILCPQCISENLPGEKFCGECGHDLHTPTKSVPADLSFDEKIAKIQRYLPEGLTEKILSQRDRIEGERKQVTVMFCDMEGFTALTERLGPEEAYSIMDRVYEILIHKVHDYEGTVNEMTGDGIVALFGAPIALEDAPQRAIRSAMAIHREMTKFNDRMSKETARIPPLKMRVGIHSGPVVVGTLGNDLRVDFKAVGDTVNLASRMEELAARGTTYVTEATFGLTEGLFRFEALGAREVKGKEGPVNVYQVIAPSTRRTRFDVSAERGLTPFVGRDRELEILLDGFQEVKESRGQAFSIVAEAGVGKSRLLYEFRKAVANEDVTFLEGKSLSYSRGVVYHPVIDVLKANFDVQEGDGDLQITEKVRDGLTMLDADEASTLPYLLELLSVEDNGVEKLPISPETRKERIVESLRTIALRGSAIRPLIMAFEDLHWADSSSEEVFKRLLESIPAVRVLLIFTHRPEFVPTWGGKSYHSQLTLNRLSNRESLAMVTHFLGTNEIQRDLVELILQKTEGIPFFIEEFVRSLREQRIIERKDSGYHLTKDIQQVTIPSTIQDVIMARIDALPEGAKEALQMGSAIDREFSHELIKQVACLPEQELLFRLSALKDSELLYERGMYPRTSYVFKHALTQEVGYSSLLTKRREEIHEKIGKAIEELNTDRLEEFYELLAYHYVHSNNKVKAVEYLDLANRKAVRAGAVEEAKAYFDQAMELLDTLPDTEGTQEQRISLLVKQAFVFGQIFQPSEYYELLTRYEPLACRVGGRGLQGDFYARMAACELAFGSLDQALQSATRAAELCEAAGQAENAGHAYHVMEWIHFFKGNYHRSIEMKDEVLRRLDKRTNLRTYLRALCAASIDYSHLGRWDEASGLAEEALRIAQEFGDNSGISFAAWTHSSNYSFKGDLSRAIEHGELALREAPMPADKAWAEQFLAWATCKAGESRRGAKRLEELLRVFRTAHYVPSQAPGLLFLGEGHLLTGDHDKARQTLEESLELSERCQMRAYIGRAKRLLGEVALKTNPDEATPHFEKAISIAGEAGAENELALAYSGMGRYHKLQGNTEQAREYLTKALEIFERLGTLIEPDKVREELAGLPQ